MSVRSRADAGMLAALPISAALVLWLARWLPVRFDYVPNELGIVSLATLERYPQQQETFWLLLSGGVGTLLAWLRRGRLAPRELGASVCGSFLILYGLTSFWAWQYLAWSVPFWFFLGWRFTALATLLLGGYVYGAYALFTGSPWLLGRWDFVGHGSWPMRLDVLRAASVLLCFISAGVLLVRAALAERDRET